MAFTGTLDKCKACDKTVYVVDMMTLEEVPYHKTWFICTHCKGKLEMTTYSSMDRDGKKTRTRRGKPKIELNGSGSGMINGDGENPFILNGDGDGFGLTISIFFDYNLYSEVRQKDDQPRTPNKLSSMFSGTLDKCAACKKTVYPLEKVTMEGECYNKTCFRCANGGCPLTHSSYAALEDVLSCKHHFAQLFMVKGNYSHVLQAAAHRRNSSTASSTDFAENNQADQDDVTTDQDDYEENL
ncbi:LIM domain-containing protein PLIM2c [Hibiscus syriacus]|uniref:LIM domain-containing protein PLIM2c n=1 Tax=Hibiscus syriacus TaxID=106335 RepID=A0A6A3A5X1_HIBSY|nr:LIM domain-containing protein PLIM2c [Hibiscus syriacus]